MSTVLQYCTVHAVQVGFRKHGQSNFVLLCKHIAVLSVEYSSIAGGLLLPSLMN